MTWVSDQVIEAMGYQKAPKNMALTAQFHCLHIFQVQGIRLQVGNLTVRSDQIGVDLIQIGIGNSVNAICKKMLNDQYADDEDQWQKDKNCAPPYVIVHFGPTEPHTASLRYFRRDGETIHTFDAFRAAKSEIRQKANEHLSSTVTSLSCALLEHGKPLPALLPVDSTVFGVTPSGETVLDMRIQVSGSVSSASSWTGPAIRKALKRVPSHLTKIDGKSASFFHNALFEKDSVKKFLNFFLAIEIATHTSFRAMDHKRCVNQFSGKRTKSWAQDLSFLREVKNWPNLRDRFLWCALFVWTHLSEEDVETFAKLKRTRDDIAHGNIQEPNAGDIGAVELLATKLHSFHQF